MMLLMTLLILFWLFYDHFCISKDNCISAEVFNAKDVMEDQVENVNAGDVKTEPEELKGLLEMFLFLNMNLNTMKL